MAIQTVGRIWYIYKVTCAVSHKSYIGLTCDSVRQRWSNHVSSAIRRGSQSILHRAIRKYGRDAFQVASLQTFGSLEEANAAEILAIALHNTIDPNGYNLSTGGMGTPGVRKPHAPETREKIRRAHIGRTPSEETRRRMSEAGKRKRFSEEARRNMSRAQSGRTLPQEARDKIADAARGRKFPRRSIALLESLLVGGHPSTTGCRGIIPEKSRWTARLGMDGRRVHLGVFDTKEQAAEAYLSAVQRRILELKARADGMIPVESLRTQIAREVAERECEEDAKARRSAAAVMRWERWREQRQ